MQKQMRKHLSAPGLINSIKQSFSYIKDPLSGKSVQYSLTDCLMSGLAMFGFKSPSLLAFDKSTKEEAVEHNLRQLYGVEKAPCDTRLRERLDEVEPGALKRAYKSCFRAVQRGKVLPLYESLDGYYLVTSDGTGFFNSENIHCEHCCVKNHRDGRKSYYHQMLCAVMAHPNQKEVIPLLSEPIRQQDGSAKNDCEQNASKRLWKQLREMHPNLKILALEDALYGTGPHIKFLQSLSMRYLINVKPGSHTWLFDWVNAADCNKVSHRRDGKLYELRYINDVPLNETHEELRVNFIECIETNKKGQAKRFTWISDVSINDKNVFELMKMGRTRWRIENETFNTLKNQGYHFEHNFGHGHKHLSTVFAHLMILAFLVDQLQQLCCPRFAKALKKCHATKWMFWEKIRHYVFNCFVDSWEALFETIADPPKVRISLNST